MSEESPQREPARREPDDTEGHMRTLVTDEPEDDTEGHIVVRQDDDGTGEEDAAGHLMPPDPRI